MRPFIASALAAALLLTVFPAAAAATPRESRLNAFVADPTAPPDRELLVRFRDDVTDSDRSDAHRRSGALRGERLRLRGWEKAELPAGADLDRAAARYRLDPRVVEAEVVLERRITRFPDDLITQQWAYHNIGQIIVGNISGTPDADIDAPEAWDVATGNREIVVAILDTGIDLSRSDLSQRVRGGFDFANGDSNPQDDNGHGTAVASVIGAMGNNGSGMTGLNWDITLMPVKICTAGGSCPGSAILNGINFAVASGADVINMSLSCDEHFDPGPPANCNLTGAKNCLSSAENQAVAAALAAGVVVVSASGNCGRDNDDATSSYPCAYAQEGNICAGATDADDHVPYFSNYGPATVDIGAPGDDIYVYAPTPPGGLFFSSGTSFSSPITAGGAALLLGRTTLTPEAVRSRLVGGGDPGSGLTAYFEGGRLNAYNAVADVFTTGQTYATHSPGDVMLLADITGDGRADLVRGTNGAGFEIAKNNRKKRKFAAMKRRTSTPPAAFTAAGDASGDGYADIILGDGAGFRTIRTKNKKGALLPVEIWSAEALGSFALAGDVNGDGRADVVNFGGSFDALLSTGTAFGASSTWSAASPATFTLLGDADGDGSDDLILWSNSGTTTISVGLSTGAAFGAASAWATSSELEFAAAGDFDGDGDTDLAGVDPADGCLSVYLSDGGAYEDPKIWTCAGIPSHLCAGRTGKETDARVDMVIRQASSGKWLMLESAH